MIIATIKKALSYFIPPVYVMGKARTEDGVDGRLVSYVDKDSPLAEQYRVLRTNLYSLSPGNPLKTLVITSTQAQEGKTVTACNLAHTLSLDPEKKILLIDCDLRRAAVHKLLGIPRKPGFSDLFDNKAELAYFLERPVFGRLYVIPSGALVQNPSELLSSSRIKEMIEDLKKSFDYIIFDTPPVVNVTDASILSRICDAVFLVVKANVTPSDMVEESFNMLKRAHAQPKACILTNLTIPLHQYYLSKYRYYYRYRYTYSEPSSGR